MATLAVHWFRKGLRLHDNPALLRALSVSAESGKRGQLIPLFILDSWYVESGRVGTNRMGFLLDTLEVLDKDLRDLGSRLVVAKGKPVDIFRQLFRGQKKVDPALKLLLTFETDTEPYAKERDKAVVELCGQEGVQVHTESTHTLYDLDRLLTLYSGGASKKGAGYKEPPLTMTGFQSLVAKAGPPADPLPKPKGPFQPVPESLLRHFDHYETVPSLEDLDYDPKEKTTWFKGGEGSALEMMDNYLKQTKRAATFEKPSTNPTALEPDTTALSPYLKFGCLSARLFFKRLKEVYREYKGKHSQPPVSLEGQLYWREMSYLIGHAVPNFDRMKGNPICRQIPWKTGGEAAEALARWEEGKTGYPAVDAVMHQLKTEGWMHHLGRHLVACFLTRGDLWVSWELGRDVFDRLLVDADWSINNFSWHWMSCSAFFHQYFRVYGPVTFFKKTDPSGAYIRKHVPCLSRFPDKYIYEPWTAPAAVQQAAGCVIGKDYPKPIVDHQKASKDNIARMKKAFDDNKGQAASEGPAAKKAKNK